MPLLPRRPRHALTPLAVAAASLFALHAPQATAATTAELEARAEQDAKRIEDLEQRLLILERKLEIQTEDVATKAKEAPVVAAGDKGFSLKNAAGDYELRFTALGQIDGRVFFDDGGTLRDTFLARRLRPTLQGTLGKLAAFRFTPEFAGANGQGDGGATSAIVDAYFDLRFAPWANLRIGKQKGPVGLERLQSGGSIELTERAFPTELVPNRDLGVNLFGEVAKGTVSYAVGVFNGTADGRDVSVSDDGLKEVEGRVFFEPFKNEYSAFKGLGFGVAGSVGAKDGTGNNFLSRYRSPGQNVFFAYGADVLADGQHVRYVPQAYYYGGPVGVLGEYVVSEQDVKRGGNAQAVRNDAYAVTASYVLTGEDASYRGVRPATPFTLGAPGWGAVEVVGRYQQLDVDDDAFTGTAATRLADPRANATEATSYGAGVNWILTSNVKLTGDFNFTEFDGGGPLAANGGDRRDEKALITRLTVQY